MKKLRVGVWKLTDEELLQLLVAVVDAELLEAVVVEDLESVDVQYSDDGVFGAVPLTVLPYLDGRVHLLDDPGEESLVDSLPSQVRCYEAGQLAANPGDVLTTVLLPQAESLTNPYCRLKPYFAKVV